MHKKKRSNAKTHAKMKNLRAMYRRREKKIAKKQAAGKKAKTAKAKKIAKKQAAGKKAKTAKAKKIAKKTVKRNTEAYTSAGPHAARHPKTAAWIKRIKHSHKKATSYKYSGLPLM